VSTGPFRRTSVFHVDENLSERKDAHTDSYPLNLGICRILNTKPRKASRPNRLIQTDRKSLTPLHIADRIS